MLLWLGNLPDPSGARQDTLASQTCPVLTPPPTISSPTAVVRWRQTFTPLFLPPHPTHKTALTRKATEGAGRWVPLPAAGGCCVGKEKLGRNQPEAVKWGGFFSLSLNQKSINISKAFNEKLEGVLSIKRGFIARLLLLCRGGSNLLLPEGSKVGRHEAGLGRAALGNAGLRLTRKGPCRKETRHRLSAISFEAAICV